MTRYAHATRLVETLRHDVSHALRGLARSPGIATAIVLVLGLGVGANAAVFTVLDRVFFQAPGGVVDPGAIRRLYANNVSPRIPGGSKVTPFLGLRDLKDFSTATRGIARIEGDYLDRRERLKPSNQSVLLTFVSSAYFNFLGVPPAQGRFFTPQENQVGSPVPVAVLSDVFWRTHFAGDQNVLGKTVRVGETTYTIVGVAPPVFEGLELEAVDLWVPLSNLAGGSTSAPLHLLARLEPGANERALDQALTTQYRQTHLGDPVVGDSSRIITAPILAARGPTLSGVSVHIIPRMSDRSLALLTRLAAVGFVVLVIAVANVASLLLMRALRRRREIAIRVALGASHVRLVSQLVTESAILAVLAGAVALLVAQWTGSLLRAELSVGLRWTQTVVDHRVVAFAGFMAIVGGVAAGLAPVLFVVRTDVNSSLKSSSSGKTAAGAGMRVGLLVTQAALCTALLACGGAFLQSLRRAGDVDRGFDPERTIQIAVPAYYANSEQTIAEIAARLRSLPAIEAVGRSYAGLSDYLTMSTKVGPSYRDTIGAGPRGPSLDFVEPDYMRAVGFRVVAGRTLTVADNVAPVAVLNEALADALFPGGKAVGSCVHVREPASPCRQVVGVVRDVRWDVTEPAPYRVYVPLAQAWAPQNHSLIPNYLVVRTRAVASSADLSLIWNTIAPMLPPGDGPSIRRVAGLLEPLLRPWQIAATLFLVLGFLGLGAAAAGIYGLVSYDVTQRSRELGVRMALGATPVSILRLVVGSGLRVILIGAVAGTMAALVGGRVVASLLFATSPYDPTVLLGTTLTLAVAAVLASLVPAWQATRVDPVIVLSSE
jgi:predicted permease